MDDYKEIVKSIRPSKRLGQNFLINKKVAKTEANFAIDKNVIELGPGLGTLTDALCKEAKKVLAIEKDPRVFEVLQENVKHKNLEMLNMDFFEVPNEKFSGYEIMISNIPYNLSSKTIMWLSEHEMTAVLCLQKEFVNHMLAQPGEHDYSKLSVISHLSFHLTLIMDVPANDFYPMPNVASAVILLKPKKSSIEKRTTEIISVLMMHKKKKIRNALVDSAKHLNLEKDELSAISEQIPAKDKRVFQIPPEELLEIARQVDKKIK